MVPNLGVLGPGYGEEGGGGSNLRLFTQRGTDEISRHIKGDGRQISHCQRRREN